MIWNNLREITFVEHLIFSFGTLFLYLSLHLVNSKVIYFSGLMFFDNPLNDAAVHTHFPLFTVWGMSQNSPVYWVFHF